MSLQQIAASMIASGKGILAIDESHGTCEKRFTTVNKGCTETTRNEYRDLLITAPGIENHISGMILFDETLRQSTLQDGTPFPKYLENKGILAGIKVDTGAKDLALHNNEKITEGLDNLDARVKEYAKLGAKFAKWRAVITIEDNIPSDACILSNAHALARYAAICQSNGIVPIVEPEVLMDGDHSIDVCYEVTLQTLQTLFDQLKLLNCELDGLILKASMVLPGKKCSDQASPEQIAQMSVDCYEKSVPEEVPGIVFLSGGQSNEMATENLQAMNALKSNLPWTLSFSYGRALQSNALVLWAEGKKNEAQTALFHRAKMNGLASLGQYSKEQEEE